MRLFRHKAVFMVALLAGICSCASGPGESKDDREQAAIRSCHLEAAARTGAASTREMPWRTTSRRNGTSVIVNIWIHTPRSAPRPSGSPDFVCRR
jgi:hypothetical protein